MINSFHHFEKLKMLQFWIMALANENQWKTVLSLKNRQNKIANCFQVAITCYG
jgi:hypothetical protein